MNNNNTQPKVERPSAKAVEQVGLRVSLIPQQDEKIKDPRVGFGKFLVAVVGGIIIVGSISGFLQYRAYASGIEVAKINAASEVLVQKSEATASTLKDAKITQIRLDALNTLLAEHRNAAAVFDFFEEHTLGDVSFSSISIGENGVVNLSASAGSFESYAAQINEISAQPLVKSVISSGLSPVYDNNDNLKQVDFALSVTFDPGIFINQPPIK